MLMTKGARSEPSLFDPVSYATGCPHERIAHLRAQGAVSWQDEAHDPSLFFPVVRGGWWIHGYDELKVVLRAPEVFSSSRGTAMLMDADPDTTAAMGNMLVNMDPPIHSRRRRLVSYMFTPRRIAVLEPAIRDIAASVIDAIAPLGRCDAVESIAAPMPMRVIAELLGIPERSRELFEISNRMVGAIDTEPAERAATSTSAAIEIQLLGHELAQQKRARPDNSLLSAYVNGTLDEAREDHEQLDDDEVGWFLLLLTVAGNETVRTATSQAIRVLAEHPDQRARLVQHLDEYFPSAIEEILRYQSPVRALQRTATERVEIGGQMIEAGDKVVCHFSSALRDERQFDRAEVFDISRPSPTVQLAFGYGEHYCLGANLARVQLRAILGEIYRRIPDIHPVGEPVFQPTPLFEALLAMPVEYTPERSRRSS
jgi:cholest-4-en-3-one 26-monooxygenase